MKLKKDERFSLSSLKAFAEGGGKGWLDYKARIFQPSEATLMGSLVDAELFKTQKVEPWTPPKPDNTLFGSKPNKEAYLQLFAAEEKKGRDAILYAPAGMIEQAKKAAAKILSGHCGKFMKGNFQVELEGLIRDRPFRGFADVVQENTVIDLKVSDRATFDGIARQFWQMKYHWQAYIYKVLSGVENVIYIFSDTDGNCLPHFVIDPDWYGIAEREISEYLFLFAMWDGKPTGIEGFYPDGYILKPLPYMGRED